MGSRELEIESAERSKLVPVSSQELFQTLQRFGLDSFRPGQREVIEAVLAAENVLCVMPTGGGKSLCYQLPALLLPGVTFVVSPLIALMKDQEDQLAALNLPATALHSNLSASEQNQRLQGLARGQFKIVFLAPERFKSRRFLELLQDVQVSLLAVDEAHCISEWGHDFRPDYTRLGWFREKLQAPTTIALTATATDLVRRDIVEQLRLQEPKVFVRGFDRPNLHYAVQSTFSRAQKVEHLLRLLAEIEGSVIIYASSRKNCEDVADIIRERTTRTVTVYHAGLQADERKQAQEDFMLDRAEVVVATNAFGMGIDKPEIRAVVHFNVPGTLEAYYQEAGRAGRDGRFARCVLLFTLSDRAIQEYFIENEYPNRMVVREVFSFLRSLKEDPIELTRAEIRDRLGNNLNEQAIGASIKILDLAGLVERLTPRQNTGILRIYQTGRDLADLLPVAAKAQRRVLRYLDQHVGDQRGEDVDFNPAAAANHLGMDVAILTQMIRELQKRIQLDYIPPFRGSATRILDRTTPLDELPIDFGKLEARKRAEYQKLDRVFDFAQSSGCRRQKILSYFGESSAPCGYCDNCGVLPSEPRGQATAKENVLFRKAYPAIVEVVLRCLRAVEEMHGRIGKHLLAGVLAGSSAKEVKRMGLHKRKSFSQLQMLQKNDIVKFLDACLSHGLLQQTGDPRRPTIVLTAVGGEVLFGRREVPKQLPLPAEMREKLEQLAAIPGFADSHLLIDQNQLAPAPAQPNRAEQGAAPSGPRPEPVATATSVRPPLPQSRTPAATPAQSSIHPQPHPAAPGSETTVPRPEPRPATPVAPSTLETSPITPFAREHSWTGQPPQTNVTPTERLVGWADNTQSNAPKLNYPSRTLFDDQVLPTQPEPTPAVPHSTGATAQPSVHAAIPSVQPEPRPRLHPQAPASVPVPAQPQAGLMPSNTVSRPPHSHNQMTNTPVSADETNAAYLPPHSQHRPSPQEVAKSNYADYYWTHLLLCRGFSLEEVSAIRRLSPLELLQHADQAIRHNLHFPLEVFEHYPFPPNYQRFLAELRERLADTE